MGTRAYLLDKSKREGIEEGVEIGVEKGRKEGVEIGVEKGRKEGIEEGRRQEKEALALALKKAGVSISFIAEITGLSAEEIEALT